MIESVRLPVSIHAALTIMGTLMILHVSTGWGWSLSMVIVTISSFFALSMAIVFLFSAIGQSHEDEELIEMAEARQDLY